MGKLDLLKTMELTEVLAQGYKDVRQISRGEVLATMRELVRRQEAPRITVDDVKLIKERGYSAVLQVLIMPYVQINPYSKLYLDCIARFQEVKG